MGGIRKRLCLLGACLMCFGLTGCAAAEEDAFQVQVICESSGIQQIFWSCYLDGDRKSTRLNSSHSGESRMPSSA